MPRRAAVPTTDLTLANRSAAHTERNPPVTFRYVAVGRTSRSLELLYQTPEFLTRQGFSNAADCESIRGIVDSRGRRRLCSKSPVTTWPLASFGPRRRERRTRGRRGGCWRSRWCWMIIRGNWRLRGGAWAARPWRDGGPPSTSP